MLELSDEIIYNYFEQNHNKKANGEFYFIDIDFREKGNHEKVIFRYASHKENRRFNKWRLEGIEKYYYLDEYLQD